MRAKLARHAFASCIVAGTLSSLAGCVTLPRENIEPFQPDAKSIGPTNIDRDQVVGLRNEPSVSEVRTNDKIGYFRLKQVGVSQLLPNIYVDKLSVNNASMYDIMRIMLDGTGITFSMDDQVANMMGYYTVSASGTLQEMLDDLADQLGIFYTYNGRSIRFEAQKQYIINMPPLGEEYFKGIEEVLQAMGGVDIKVNAQDGFVVFKANRDSSHKINDYLVYVRENKYLIVYDMHIWEVELNDEHSNGIKWNKLEFTLPKGAVNISGSSGVSDSMNGINIGTAYNIGKLSIDALASFLSSQGNLRSLSEPQLTLISGTKSEFKVGSFTKYVSKVGSTLSSTVTQTNVETDEVSSGVQLSLFGDVNEGTVYTKIDLKVTDLVRFNTWSALETTLQLPQTIERVLSSQIRVKPGDSIMLAGMNFSRDVNDIKGLPGPGKKLTMPLEAKKQMKRSELILVMNPRVIRFVDGKGDESGKLTRFESEKSAREKMQLPAPVAETKPTLKDVAKYPVMPPLLPKDKNEKKVLTDPGKKNSTNKAAGKSGDIGIIKKTDTEKKSEVNSDAKTRDDKKSFDQYWFN